MKTLFCLLLITAFNLQPILAQTTSSESAPKSDFSSIIIHVMNRGTNILMSISFLFILLYTIYIAIAVSFGSMKASAFLSILWGTAIVFAGGALAKIYYLFLT